MLWQVIVAMEAGTVLASSLLYLLALHAGRGLVERYGRFIGVGRVTDDAVEIRYVIPTTEASTHTHFCQLRTDYFKCVLDQSEISCSTAWWRGFYAFQLLIGYGCGASGCLHSRGNTKAARYTRRPPSLELGGRPQRLEGYAVTVLTRQDARAASPVSVNLGRNR